MTQQHTDNILFSLDGKDVMRNRQLFKSGVKFAEAGHKAMAYFGEDGQGRLTEGAARHLAGFIKACIKNPSLLQGRDKAWAPLSKKYAYRKNKAGGSSSLFWYFEGNIHDNIDIIWRGKHSRTVGIKRNTKAKRPMGRGTYNVAQVAKILEFGGGTGIPARPLFGPASHIFLKKHFPEWGRMATKVFTKTYSEYFEEVQDNFKADIINNLINNTKRHLSQIDIYSIAVSDSEKIREVFS